MPDHEQIPLEQIDLPVLPGWGGEQFPDEKPRRDLNPGESDGVPTAAAVAAAAATGEEAAANFTHEDRRPLDRRRRKARGIDALIVAPVALAIFKVTGEITVATAVLFLAIELSYFLVLETLQGQSVGKKMASLRVVRPDGSAAGATRIAVRTILRPIDYVIGIIVVLATGKRRLRLGDLLAGTIVRDDNRVFRRAPESPLVVVYPILLIGGAIAATLALQPADPTLANRNAHPYMAKIDSICEKQLRQSRALAANGQFNLISARLVQQQELRKIERLPKPPAEVRADVKAVLRHERRIKASMDRYMRAVQRAPNPSAAGAEHGAAALAAFETAQRRFADMGLPNCARSGASG